MEDRVGFSSQVFFCEEQDGVVRVDVIRLGRAELTATVEYHTVDGSAVAGHKYHAEQGTLEFAPWEERKSIEVSIVENDAFDATLEFEVHLSNPIGMELDPYQYKCRVLVVDDDTFPTNKFSKELSQGLHGQVSATKLLAEFLRMNLHDTKFRRCAIRNMISDQFTNLKYVWNVYLLRYLVDDILARGSQAANEAGLLGDALVAEVCIVIALGIFPQVVQFLLERRNAFRRLRGQAINRLQGNIMRKFLNYDEGSRKAVSQSDLTMAITRDVPDLVEKSLAGLFQAVQKAGLLLVLFMFAVLQSQERGWQDMAFSILLFFVNTVALLVFLGIRHAGTVARRAQVFKRETNIVSFLNEVTENVRLISDYDQKAAMVGIFSGRIADSNSAVTASAVWEIANKHFAPFVASFVCGAYVLFSFRAVMRGDMGVGSLVAGMSVWQGIGQCYQSLYDALLVAQRATAPLANVVFYMNLPVDVTHRMLLSRKTLAAQETSSGRKASKCVHDILNIRGNDVTFAYPKFSGGGVPVLNKISFEIPQGKLVAVVGPPGSGKATFLQLLGDVLLPPLNPGVLHVPPHLRLLHVSMRPQFMSHMSMFQNLCFGPSDGCDEAPGRVLAICERLGMSSDALALIKKEVRNSPGRALTLASCEMEVGGAGAMGTPASVAQRELASKQVNSLLSHTDMCILHLARAFVMNPDVLVLHKPLANFDDTRARLVLDLMHEFVHQRGLEKPPKERALRRPRTCIFSALAVHTVHVADMVLRVAGGTVQPLHLDQIDQLRAKVSSLFADLDTHKTGRVSREDFLAVVGATPLSCVLLGLEPETLQGLSEVEREARLTELFNCIDRTDAGAFDANDLWFHVSRLPRNWIEIPASACGHDGVTLDGRPDSRGSVRSSDTKPSIQAPFEGASAWGQSCNKHISDLCDDAAVPVEEVPMYLSQARTNSYLQQPA